MESLTYLRPAKAKNDGWDGFLYIHNWPTGFQLLIFPSKEKANERIDKIEKKNAELANQNS